MTAIAFHTGGEKAVPFADDDTVPDFGLASYAKRGRNPRWPYVPIIVHPPQPGTPRRRTEQVKKRAFASSDEATACAQRVIDARREEHERRLTIPRLRTYREACGYPREITDCAVTDGTRTGRVVESANILARAEDGTVSIRERLLIEWPGTARDWSDAADVRLVPARSAPATDSEGTSHYEG
ncbi:hypothetical protein [Amycolatopsis rubida]|uniref:Uncharacterized protein n=1 Tax=Amycolatopsis rubida TaxID=112413 RepID=A0A1I5X6S5_9PSEU|nr:hypothetical protein [Amycolatopsis rubida]SFQ27347.1 hypothetical protein SAMN05421854_11049 [Amycolatopsis rubida]